MNPLNSKTKNANPVKSGPGSWAITAPSRSTTRASKASIKSAPILGSVVHRAVNSLTVGGLTRLTTIDFPGRLSAVVFCQGCPWRCAYCHNPELRPGRSQAGLQWDVVMAFLQRRQGLLDGVVFSGGEPTLQKGLLDAVLDVKEMGFQVGLHTAGPYPLRLAQVLPSVDWVGMDIKAPFDQYPKITGVAASGRKALASTRLILDSGVSHEFRTTVDGCLLEGDKLVSLASSLTALGVRRYALQEQRSPGLGKTPIEIPDALVAKIGVMFEHFGVRRAS